MEDVNISKFRAQVVRAGSTPASPGFVVSEGQDPVNPSGNSIFVPYSGAISNVDFGEFGLDTGFVTLDTTPTNIPTEQGTIFWDADDETVDIVLNGYTMKIGEDLFYPVKNQTGSTIAKGVAVRFNGTVGNSGRLLIAPFIANGSVPSSRFMGVTAEEILNGEDGKVLYFGRVRGINTNSFNEGDILYASTTSAGGYQTAIPVAPNNIVQVAAVVTKSATVGTIFVRPTLGSNINKDEGVKITSGTTGDLLQLQAGGLWENKTKAQILGGTSAQFVKGDGSLDSNTYGTGTVTSVGLSSATSGVTIGSTPITTSGTITLAIATASGSQNGLLSSTDWTTFNGKQNALTNPVTGTGTSGTLPKFTGSTTIGNSLFTDNGTNAAFGGANYYSGTDLRTFNISAPLYAGLSFWANNQNVGNIVGFGATGNLSLNADQSNLFSNTKIILSIDDVERFAVFSNGNVTIANTPTDAGFKLDVNGTGRFSGNLTLNTSSLILGLGNGGSNEAVYFNYNSNAASRSWRIIKDWTVFGDFQIQQSTTQTGTTYADILRFTSTGAATFSSSVSVNGASATTALNVQASGANGILLDQNLADSASSTRIFFKMNTQTYAMLADTNGLNFMTGAGAGSTSGSPKVIITSGGNVGIGTTSPATAGGTFTGLDIRGSGGGSLVMGTTSTLMSYIYVDSTALTLQTTGTRPILFVPGGNEKMRITSAGVVTITDLGTGTVTSTAGVLSAVSDSSLKVEDGFIDSAIEKVLNLKPRYFYWNEKSGLPKDIRQLGFYAQEVNQALGEEAANTPKDENTPWGITDRSMIAMLTKAIQEQQEIINDLKQKIS